MSALLGADDRRLDAVALRLGGHRQDLQSLRLLAQCAVAEMRASWSGLGLEMTSQRWEREGERALTEISAALGVMAEQVRAQAGQQRRTSRGGVGEAVDHHLRFGSPEPGGAGVRQRLIHGTELHPGQWNALHGPPGSEGSIDITLAQGGQEFQMGALSLQGGNRHAEYGLSAAAAAATAGYLLEGDDRGNLVASANASVAAYLGVATGRVHGGSELLDGSAAATVFVGVQASTGASGLLGRDGARGHLRAEVFAGVDAEVEATGSAGGVTAAAGAEVSFGIGAHADLDAEVSSAKVGILMDLGVTLGVGAGARLDVSVSPKELVANARSALGELGDAVGMEGHGSAHR